MFLLRTKESSLSDFIRGRVRYFGVGELAGASWSVGELDVIREDTSTIVEVLVNNFFCASNS